MQEWVITVIYGIVEGITEFLPISSTGHLIIVEYLLKNPRSEFFNIGIQAGAVLAVVLIYWSKLWGMACDWNKPENRDYLAKLAAAFFVTAVLGLLVKKLGFHLPEDPTPVAWAVLVGALLIFASESFLKHHSPTPLISWRSAAIIGAAQVLAAVFPGTSRSAITIIAAMLCGVTRLAGTEFSFLLSIPTMFAATGVALWGQIKHEGLNTGELDQFALGFVVSAVVAFIAVKWLLGYIRTHSFIPFAWYRLALGLGLLAWLTWQS